MTKEFSECSQRIPLAQILKRHTYRENKWKCRACSGQANPWYEELTEIFVAPSADGHVSSAGQVIPVQIEAKIKDEFFFVTFPIGFDRIAGQYIWVERARLPNTDPGQVYLSDLMGKTVRHESGEYKIVAYFENGDPLVVHGSLTLLLRNAEKLEIEIPFRALRKLDDGWTVDDLELWRDLSGEGEPEE